MGERELNRAEQEVRPGIYMTDWRKLNPQQDQQQRNESQVIADALKSKSHLQQEAKQLLREIEMLESESIAAASQACNGTDRSSPTHSGHTASDDPSTVNVPLIDLDLTIAETENQIRHLQSSNDELRAVIEDKIQVCDPCDELQFQRVIEENEALIKKKKKEVQQMERRIEVS